MTTLYQLLLLLLLLLLDRSCAKNKMLEVTDRTIGQLIGPNSLTTILFYSPGCQPCTDILNIMYRVSAKLGNLHPELHFGRVDTHSQPLLTLRYHAAEVPQLKIFPHSSSPIDFHGEVTEEKLLKFLRGLRLQGGVRVRLAQAGEQLSGANVATGFALASGEQQEAGLVTVTSDSYESIVLANNKSVLLALRTKDCGNECSEFERIAKVFLHDRHHVVFAQIDVEKDTKFARHFHVQHNPTLLWFPRGDKNNIIRYGGEIDLHEIVGFINDMTGTRRQIDGSLEVGAGRVEQLESLFRQRATDLVLGRNMDAMLQEADRIVAELPHHEKHTEFYLRIIREVGKGHAIDKVLEEENSHIMKLMQKQKQLAPGERDAQLQLHNIITGITDIVVDLLQKERLADEEAATEKKRQQQREKLRAEKKRKEEEKERKVVEEKTEAARVMRKEEL